MLTVVIAEALYQILHIGANGDIRRGKRVEGVRIAGDSQNDLTGNGVGPANLNFIFRLNASDQNKGCVVEAQRVGEDAAEFGGAFRPSSL